MSLFTRFYYPTKLIFQRFAAPAVIYSPWTKSLLNVYPSIKIKVPRLFLIEKKKLDFVFFCRIIHLVRPTELVPTSSNRRWNRRVLQRHLAFRRHRRAFLFMSTVNQIIRLRQRLRIQSNKKETSFSRQNHFEIAFRC